MKSPPTRRDGATPLLIRLGGHNWLHRLVAFLHVYPIAGLLLRRFPVQRWLEPSGLTYRVTSLDQLSIEFGMFVREEYAPALGPRPVTSFIDLGCNAGWFAIWLASRGMDSRCLGLLVDAHPRMVGEATWHMERNRLPCAVVHGAVGLPADQSSSRFYLHPSSAASTTLPYQAEKQLPVKGAITEITVPAVSIAFEWRQRFGEARIDLLKVDIEGKELDFVRYEGAFLQERVGKLILEWHKWCVSLSELDAALAAFDFKRRGVYNESEMAGVALYFNASIV